MESQEDLDVILREFNIIFDSKARLSQIGGLEPYGFLRKGKFLERWESQLGKKNL